MKRDEPFDSSTQSKPVPDGLVFREAQRKDIEAISLLMAERNPSQSYIEIEAGTKREIDRVETGDCYKLYVAGLHNEVIGFCRFYHSE